MIFRLTFLFLLTLSAWGAPVYYIASNGNNGNPGTEASPWLTPAYAQTQISVQGTALRSRRGDTFLLTLTFEPPVDDLIIEAYGSGALPIWDGQSVLNEIIDCVTRTNTITRFMHLKNGGPEGGDTTGGNWTGRFGTNTLEDSIVERHASDCLADGGADAHIIVRRCFLTGSFDDGITLHSTASALVESCIISNCAEGISHSGTAMQMTVNDTIFINNPVDIDGLSECVSVLNRCWFKGRSGAGWTFFKGSNLATTFNYCLFDASVGTSSTQGEFTPQAPGTIFLNNCTFYGGSVPAGNFSLSASTVLKATNCIVRSWWRCAALGGGTFDMVNCLTNGITTGTITSFTGGLTTDPLFVTPTSGNYRLKSTSPAINAGLNLGLLLDLDNRAVANPPEIGAYEYSPAQIQGGVTISGGVTFQ